MRKIHLFVVRILLFVPVAGLAQSYSITDFGAVADSQTVNTVAIQRAIDRCAAAGGGYSA